MEKLFQIKDLFPGKNKVEAYNVKEDKWLKTQFHRENMFKDFSQALNKQIKPENFQRKESQDSVFRQKEVNRAIDQSVEVIKPEVQKHQKQKDDTLEETENLEESSLVIPVVSNNVELNLVELHKEEDFYNKEELVPENDKNSLGDVECFALKDFNATTDNLSEKFFQKENENLILDNEKIPVRYEKKEKFTEIHTIPFVVENQNNFQEIKEEETLRDNGRLAEIMSTEFETLEKDTIPQEIKHKIDLQKESTKVSNQKIKDLVSNNASTQQKTVNVLDKLAQNKNLDFARNFGTDHAFEKSKTKVGIVSTKRISLVNVAGNQKHRMVEQNFQKALDASSYENDENRTSSSRQDTLIFKQEESITAPKIVIQKYDEARQNYTDSVSGVIAAISEQMEELKRVRRNSLNVKIDLANGESLNCQLILSKENLNVRFPSIAEAFKTQLLERWQQLKQFAEERKFNLSTPFFANSLSQ